MRPHTRILALLIGLTMAGPAAAQSRPKNDTRQTLNVEQLTGEWTGTVKFFDAALAERVGELPITLTLTPPARGIGQLGAATVRVTEVKPHRDRLEVVTTLDNPPHIDDALSKQHLVLLITSVTPGQLTGEAHLKSNSRFDPRMREGYLVLKRAGDR